MSCREFVELFLIEWLEGDLPVRRTHECQRHLEACEHCSRYVASYRSARAAVAALRQSA